jgi:hypothetical protein
MPVSQDVADRIKEQLGDWEPKSVPLADAEPAPAAVGGHSLADVGGDLSARVKKGVRGGDELIKAGIHAAVGPLIPETGKAGEIAGRIMRPVFEDDAKAINERAKNPQTFVGKVLGGAAEGAGGMLTMPMGGGLARNIIAAVGMGEGAVYSVISVVRNIAPPEKERGQCLVVGSVRRLTWGACGQWARLSGRWAPE